MFALSQGVLNFITMINYLVMVFLLKSKSSFFKKENSNVCHVADYTLFPWLTFWWMIGQFFFKFSRHKSSFLSFLPINQLKRIQEGNKKKEEEFSSKSIEENNISFEEEWHDKVETVQTRLNKLGSEETTWFNLYRQSCQTQVTFVCLGFLLFTFSNFDQSREKPPPLPLLYNNAFLFSIFYAENVGENNRWTSKAIHVWHRNDIYFWILSVERNFIFIFFRRQKKIDKF